MNNTLVARQKLLLPATATLLGTTSFYQSLNSDGSSPWSRVDIPADISIQLNQNGNVSFSSTFVILDLGSATRLFLTPSTPVYMSSSWRIKMWGIVWYNALPIKSQISLESGLGASVSGFIIVLKMPNLILYLFL
jgi:hypothetical protein